MGGFWAFKRTPATPSVLNASACGLRRVLATVLARATCYLCSTIVDCLKLWVSSKPPHTLLWSWCSITAVVKKQIYQLSYNISTSVTFQSSLFVCCCRMCGHVYLPQNMCGGRRTTVRSCSLPPCFWDRVSPTDSAKMSRYSMLTGLKASRWFFCLFSIWRYSVLRLRCGSHCTRQTPILTGLYRKCFYPLWCWGWIQGPYPGQVNTLSVNHIPIPTFFFSETLRFNLKHYQRFTGAQNMFCKHLMKIFLNNQTHIKTLSTHLLPKWSKDFFLNIFFFIFKYL